MIKVLLSIVIAAFTFTGVAKADAKISGFMQHIIGMGDDIDGGVTIAHPYRFTEGLKSAYFSPHYHKICTGWIDGDIVKRVNEETGWVVKQISNFDDDKQCYNVVKYLLSHEAVFLKDPTKRSSEQSYSYYGECQNRKFKVESVLKYSEDGYDQLNKIFQKKLLVIKITPPLGIVNLDF